jgi:hypothetical protein
VSIACPVSAIKLEGLLAEHSRLIGDARLDAVEADSEIVLELLGALREES